MYKNLHPEPVRRHRIAEKKKKKNRFRSAAACVRDPSSPITAAAAATRVSETRNVYRVLPPHVRNITRRDIYRDNANNRILFCLRWPVNDFRLNFYVSAIKHRTTPSDCFGLSRRMA